MDYLREIPFRRHVSEAEAEKMCDRILWRRLETDPTYQNAEDAESQKAREDELTTAIWAELEARYIID